MIPYWHLPLHQRLDPRWEGVLVKLLDVICALCTSTLCDTLARRKINNWGYWPRIILQFFACQVVNIGFLSSPLRSSHSLSPVIGKYWLALFPHENGILLFCGQVNAGNFNPTLCLFRVFQLEKQAMENIGIKFAFKYVLNRTRKLDFGPLDSTQILFYRPGVNIYIFYSLYRRVVAGWMDGDRILLLFSFYGYKLGPLFKLFGSPCLYGHSGTNVHPNQFFCKIPLWDFQTLVYLFEIFAFWNFKTVLVFKS